MKQHILRYFIYCLGFLILALGLTLTIKANLGTGPWPALNVGLASSFGLTVGSWTFIVGIVLILINSILIKELPSFLSIIPIFILGIFLDFWLLIVFNNITIQTLMFQFGLLLVGIMLIAIGVSLYIQTKLPLNPIDGFMLAVQKRFQVSMRKGKTITELVALFFAILFSGPIGIGTIFVALLIGPTVQYFFNVMETLVKPVITEKSKDAA
ncbi:membrane protein [Evansella sp. AB-P1]|uniref:YczE/YyaS/YitT family protein n=1 Tax=Evansella sp. AB-P1 TaxID=3037653 RepID=UPI00241C7E77|nr:membrane protein [Evansella sp. AB-P1]MDG5789533.1 membrane protein [Evansella sp. AB-P1]